MAVAYGGADYYKSNADMQKRLAQSRYKEQNDPSYNQSEIARTLQVMKDQQSKGLDTSAQQKYLSSNLGYKPPTTQNTGAALSNGYSPAPQQSAPQSNVQYGNEMMNAIRERAQKQSQPFSYDPNSDPAYQAALRRAQENAQTASGNAMAELNKRGILNSSITSDRLGQIEQSEYGRVSDTILPQLMQQAYSRYQNEQAQQQQQLANLMNVAQMYQSEDQRGIDNKNTTAGLTGYLPTTPEAQQYIDAILKLKQQAETPGITAAGRKDLSAQADQYRATLASMGVDPNAYSAKVNYNQASQVPSMMRTMQGQQLDNQQKQQGWENNFNQSQFDYQKARDLIADKQYQQQFDEDNRRFGLNFALDKAYKNGQLGLDWAKFNYAKSQDKAGGGGRGGGSGKTAKPNDLSKISDNIRKSTSYYDLKTGQYVTNQNAAEQALANYAQQYNLSDNELAVISSNIGLNVGSKEKSYGDMAKDVLSKLLGN